MMPEKVDRRGFLGRLGIGAAAVVPVASLAKEQKGAEQSPPRPPQQFDEQGRLLVTCPCCGEKQPAPMSVVGAKDGTTLLCNECYRRLREASPSRGFWTLRFTGGPLTSEQHKVRHSATPISEQTVAELFARVRGRQS